MFFTPHCTLIFAFLLQRIILLLQTLNSYSNKTLSYVKKENVSVVKVLSTQKHQKLHNRHLIAFQSGSITVLSMLMPANNPMEKYSTSKLYIYCFIFCTSNNLDYLQTFTLNISCWQRYIRIDI